MNGNETTRYSVGEKIYEIPTEKERDFLSDFPNAVEVKKFIVGVKIYNIPLDKVEEFKKDFPQSTNGEVKKKEPQEPPQAETPTSQISAPTSKPSSNGFISTFQEKLKQYAQNGGEEKTTDKSFFQKATDFINTGIKQEAETAVGELTTQLQSETQRLEELKRRMAEENKHGFTGLPGNTQQQYTEQAQKVNALKEGLADSRYTLAKAAPQDYSIYYSTSDFSPVVKTKATAQTEIMSDALRALQDKPEFKGKTLDEILNSPKDDLRYVLESKAGQMYVPEEELAQYAEQQGLSLDITRGGNFLRQVPKSFLQTIASAVSGFGYVQKDTGDRMVDVVNQKILDAKTGKITKAEYEEWRRGFEPEYEKERQKEYDERQRMAQQGITRALPATQKNVPAYTDILPHLSNEYKAWKVARKKQYYEELATADTPEKEMQALDSFKKDFEQKHSQIQGASQAATDFDADNIFVDIGEGLVQASEAFKTNPRFKGELLSDVLPAATGSMLAFAAGGVGGSAAAGIVSAGVLGSFSNAASLYEDAIRSGASEYIAMRALAKGLVIGTSEAVPIGHFLSRLNKITGGRLKSAIIQSTEEGAQEFFQDVANNMTAKELYDASREIINDETLKQTAAGILLGGIMGGAAGSKAQTLKGEEKQMAAQAAETFESLTRQDKPEVAKTEIDQTKEVQKEIVQPIREEPAMPEAEVKTGGVISKTEQDVRKTEAEKAGEEAGVLGIEPTAAEGAEIAPEVAGRSILNQDTDLKGDSKEAWMQEAVFPKDDIYIGAALNENKYQQAISEGRMTANDAKTIIESAGLEVPKDILEAARVEFMTEKEWVEQYPTEGAKFLGRLQYRKRVEDALSENEPIIDVRQKMIEREGKEKELMEQQREDELLRRRKIAEKNSALKLQHEAITAKRKDIVGLERHTHQTNVQKAIDNGDYLNWIANKIITPDRAIAIIESAELSVPQEILEMAQKETGAEPAPIEETQPISPPQKTEPHAEGTGTKTQSPSGQASELVGEKEERLRLRDAPQAIQEGGEQVGEKVKPVKEKILTAKTKRKKVNFLRGEAALYQPLNEWEYAMQYFAQGGKIHTDDFIAETGFGQNIRRTRRGMSEFRKRIWMHGRKGGAMRMDDIVMEIAGRMEHEVSQKPDQSEIRQAIIDVITRHDTPSSLAREFSQKQTDKAFLEEFGMTKAEYDSMMEYAEEQNALDDIADIDIETLPEIDEISEQIFDKKLAETEILSLSEKWDDYVSSLPTEQQTQIYEYEQFHQENEPSGVEGEDVAMPASEAGSQEEQPKSLADRIRQAKIDTTGGQLLAVPFPPQIWNGFVEAIAKAVEAGVKLADAIAEGIKWLQTNFPAEKYQDYERAFNEFKIRKFAKRLIDDENVSDEVKKGLKADAVFYIPISNEITQSDARAIIDEAKSALGDSAGLQNVLDKIKDEKNGISPRVRVTLAENLINEYEDAGKSDKAIETAEFITQYGTKLGQGVQAFAIWDKLSSTNLMKKTEKDLERQGKKMTEEEKKRIKDLIDRVKKAPKGFQKDRAIQDLLREQMKMQGVDWGDVAMSVWYAHILSGYSTQKLNFIANAAQTAAELYTALVYNPQSFPFLIQGLYEGWGRGLLNSWATLKTGYEPFRQNKYDIGTKPSVLETTRFKGRKWNPLNYYKYVRRFMAATDELFFYGLNEMRAYELAHKEASKQNKAEPDRKIWEMVSEKLFKTKERRLAAQEQAKKEGLKGTEYRIRVAEIMEQSRPQKMVEDAQDFAATGTFNHKPLGTLGFLMNYVSTAVEGIGVGKGIRPLKFIIPFTNIITNVANSYANFFPLIGYTRAIRGKIGNFILNEDSQFIKKYSPEERAKLAIKATTGAIGMMALYALTDDDDGVFEITASGTGDYKKNYELAATGWQKYSIKIGDKWFSYMNTPLAIPLSMIGFIRDREKYGGEFSEEDVITKTQIVAWNTAKYFTDMTFLSSLSDFMSSFSKENPEIAQSYFEGLLKRTAKSFVVPNIVTQTSRWIQDVYDMPLKDATNLWEEIVRDIPILRDSQDNLINSLGEEVTPESDRFIHSSEKDNAVWNFVVKNKAWIGKVNKGSIMVYDRGIEREMTDDEYYRFSKERGRIIRDYISRRMDYLNRLNASELDDEMRAIKSEATTKAKKIVTRR